MKNNPIDNLKAHPELVLLLLVVVIIGMLIIPLQTALVDLLLALNTSIALSVLIGSFYVGPILTCLPFRSVLQITTPFHLGLSISTSRLITNKMTIEPVPSIFIVAEQNKAQWERKNMFDLLRNRFFLDYGVRLP